MKPKLFQRVITDLIMIVFICVPGVSMAQILSPLTMSQIIRESDENMKKKRTEWIESMHRAEPGVNWKIIENETRQAKYRLSKLNLRKSGSQSLAQNKYADGRIVATWIEKGSDNLAGRIMISDFDASRNLVYAVSAGGHVWRGTIEGKDWKCLNNRPKFPGSLIRIIKMGNVNRIVVVSSQTVYYSDDEGTTWNQAKGFEELQKWGWLNKGMVVNDENHSIYVNGTEWDWTNWKSISAIYKSTDGGENFTLFNRYAINSEKIDFWAPRYGGNDAFITVMDTTFHITASNIDTIINSGENVMPIKSERLNNFMLTGTVVNDITYLKAALVIQGIYNGNYNPDTTFFYQSTDRGQSWALTGKLVGNPFSRNSFAVSLSDPKIMYYGGVEVNRTTDNGDSWIKVNTWPEYYGDMENKLHADIPGINIYRDYLGKEITFVGTDGGLYKSEDRLQTVKNMSLKGLNVSQYYSVYTHKNNPSVVFVGSQDQGFQRCLSDSGSTLGFTQTISGDYGHISSSDGGNSLWTVYPTFAMLYKNATTDLNGYFWTFQGTRWLWLPPTYADPENPDAAYLTGGGTDDGSHLWYIKREGDNITALEMPFNFAGDSLNSSLTSFAISEINKNYFYALTNDGRFWTSSDKGSTWTETKNFKGPGNHYFYGASILPSKKEFGKIYIAGSGYSNPEAFVSSDNGESFTPIDSGLPPTLIYEFVASEDEKYLFAATEAGPYIYFVDENRWFDIAGSDAPDETYWTVDYIPSSGIARFGTYGRGIWDFKIESFTGIKDITNLDDKINISCFPNPSRGACKISFNLDKSTEAIVRIYDSEGRIVREIFSGEMQAGTRDFYWDGKTDAGNDVPTGTYLCTVAAGRICSFARLNIIK